MDKRRSRSHLLSSPAGEMGTRPTKKWYQACGVDKGRGDVEWHFIYNFCMCDTTLLKLIVKI